MPPSLISNAHWLIRVSFASVFAYHGYNKFIDTSMQSEMLGVPVGLLLLTGFAELAGAALVIIGGFGIDAATRLGGVAVIPVMVGAIAKFHWPQWSFVASDAHRMGGMEFQVTLLAIALFFVLTGNTVLSTSRSRTPSAEPNERIPVRS